MSVSLAYLERCPAVTGFPVAGLEKVVLLGEVAREIGAHPLLSRVLLLKGGTALNLAFGPPTRLSVDLDFNYVGELVRERMLVERPRVERALDDLARRAGYRVQRSGTAFAGRKSFLHYRSVLGHEDRIEVDVNFLLRLPLEPPVIGELWQPGALDRPRLALVSNTELIIGKVCALLDRCAARDVWDVAHLPNALADALVGERFRRLLVVLLGTLVHPPDAYSEARLVARITLREVETQLKPMLVSGLAVESERLVRSAWARIAQFLEATDVERAYFDALSRG